MKNKLITLGLTLSLSLSLSLSCNRSPDDSLDKISRLKSEINAIIQVRDEIVKKIKLSGVDASTLKKIVKDRDESKFKELLHISEAEYDKFQSTLSEFQVRMREYPEVINASNKISRSKCNSCDIEEGVNKALKLSSNYEPRIQTSSFFKLVQNGPEDPEMSCEIVQYGACLYLCTFSGPVAYWPCAYLCVCSFCEGGIVEDICI